MNICAKCGFENDNNAKNCVNCLTDLHWAKVNLGKFHGTADDTRRIGIASRRERGYSVPDDEITPLEPILVEQDIAKKTVNWLLIGFLAGLFSTLCIYALAPFGFIVWLLAFPVILLAIGGAYLGRKNLITSLGGAIVAAILWLLVLMFTCALCQ